MKINPKNRGPFILIGIIIIAFGGFQINNYLNGKLEQGEFVRPTVPYAENLPSDHHGVVAFNNAFENCHVILACEEDLTNDGIKDIIIIYKEDGHIRLTIAMGDSDGGYSYSEPIPAPVENQKIQFKNIDSKDEMEFMLSGEKNGQVGYGIFRVIDSIPVNLFGDGMEDCV